MESEASLVSYLVNSMAMIILMCGVLGMTQKITSVLLAIWAYPVYLSLYYFEAFSTIIGFRSRQFFRLNIPKSNPRKYVMNFLSAVVVVSLFSNVFTFYAAVHLPPEEQAKSIVSLLFGSSRSQVWHNGVAVMSVFFIYLISYWSEPDDRYPMEKIDQLSVPSLWKSALKI